MRQPGHMQRKGAPHKTLIRKPFSFSRHDLFTDEVKPARVAIGDGVVKAISGDAKGSGRLKGLDARLYGDLSDLIDACTDGAKRGLRHHGAVEADDLAGLTRDHDVIRAVTHGGEQDVVAAEALHGDGEDEYC